MKMKISGLLAEKEADINVGDRVMLTWYGDTAVPQWLNYAWATVLRIKSTGSLEVKADQDTYGTRTIRPERHVRKHVVKQG